MRNKCEANHVLYRDGIYYYVRRVPYDLTSYYNVKRLGLRLQNMDIPAIQVVRASDEANDATLRLSEACELYLRLKGAGKDKVFIRTANRNTQYVTKLLGDRPISSYSSNEAAQFRDWCVEQGMGIKTVKRVFAKT